MTIKQYWSRVNNLRDHLIENTQRGTMARQEMHRLTGKQVYTDTKFQKMLSKGKTYKKRQIARDVSRIEKKKRKQLHSVWKRQRKSGRTKLTKAKFFRANKHEIGIDIADLEQYYDSP